MCFTVCRKNYFADRVCAGANDGAPQNAEIKQNILWLQQNLAVVTVLTWVLAAGRGGEWSPGREQEEQEAKKDRHSCISPVTFPERRKPMQKKKP